MTPNELLNELLEWFAYNSNAHPHATAEAVTVDYLERRREKVGLFFKNLEWSINTVLEKLEKDGNIVIVGRTDRAEALYKITFEGIVFINNGGYVKQAKRNKWNTINSKISTITLAIGSILAAIGTLGLLYSEYLKFKCQTNSISNNEAFISITTGFFLLLYITIGLLMVWLIAKEIINKPSE